MNTKRSIDPSPNFISETEEKKVLEMKRMRGATLTEVVIAISVIAFSVPLILAASGGAHQSRQNAEADTRSAWIVGDVKRRIIHDWSNTSQRSDEKETFIFPSKETPKSMMKMYYDQQGSLIEEDNEKAVYLVFVEATPFLSTQNHSDLSPLACIKIKIQHPAKAPSNKQKNITYQYVGTQYGF